MFWTFGSGLCQLRVDKQVSNQHLSAPNISLRKQHFPPLELTLHHWHALQTFQRCEDISLVAKTLTKSKNIIIILIESLKFPRDQSPVFSRWHFLLPRCNSSWCCLGNRTHYCRQLWCRLFIKTAIPCSPRVFGVGEEIQLENEGPCIQPKNVSYFLRYLSTTAHFPKKDITHTVCLVCELMD